VLVSNLSIFTAILGKLSNIKGWFNHHLAGGWKIISEPCFKRGATSVPEVWYEVMRLVLDVPDLAQFSRVSWRQNKKLPGESL